MAYERLLIYYGQYRRYLSSSKVNNQSQQVTARMNTGIRVCYTFQQLNAKHYNQKTGGLSLLPFGRDV